MAHKKGHIPWNKGLTKDTDKRIKKYGQKLKGKKFTEERIENLRKSHMGQKSWNKGKKMSPEFCQKVSQGHKGQIAWNKGQSGVYSSETLKKMSIAKIGGTSWAKGKKFSKKYRKKLSKSHSGPRPWMKGKKMSPETCKKMSNSAKGKIFTEETRKKLRKIALERIKNTFGQISPNYSKQACLLFEKINREYSLHGIHAENGGEFHIKELGYFLDFYEPTLNLAIEFYENYRHYKNGKLSLRDVRREKEIKQYLKCSFIRIKENHIGKVFYNQLERAIKKGK